MVTSAVEFHFTEADSTQNSCSKQDFRKLSGRPAILLKRTLP